MFGVVLECLVAFAFLFSGSTSSSSKTSGKIQNVVVIGGGWAGFGTAHALLRSGGGNIKVTILEGSPRPGGLASGWTSASGRNVEAGIHGFWRCYANIDKLIKTDLKLVGDKSPFTPWTPSALWTRDGLSVTSPVFQHQIQLPTPLGTALLPKFQNISPFDMLSAIPLAIPWLDFDGTATSWRTYDKITAKELFYRFGMTQNLYKQFLLPLLLVLPMCPGEDCSAAAALSLFSYFALEHQSDFDVKWLRGSATDLIFNPWRDHLEAMGVTILNDKRVTKINLNADKTSVISIESSDGSLFSNISAVVSCTGINACQGILRANPDLAAKPDFASIFRLKAVDVVAVRLWLNKRIKLPYASNVAGGDLGPGLDTIGCTFYDVAALQDKAALGASPEFQAIDDTIPTGHDDHKSQNSVLEVDFYYAQMLVGQSDETVLQRALDVLNTCQLKSSSAKSPLVCRQDVEDFVVVKIPRAVSHFAPGAFSALPGLETSVRNFLFAGDWVDRGGHASWSQEKALVTGYQAAEVLLDRWEQEGDSTDDTARANPDDNVTTTGAQDRNNVMATGAQDRNNVTATGAQDRNNVLTTGAQDRNNVLTSGAQDRNMTTMAGPFLAASGLPTHLQGTRRIRNRRPAASRVIPVAPMEPHVALGRSLAARARARGNFFLGLLSK